MEEAQEIIEAPDRDNLIWEMADLFYHLLVYMAKKEIKPQDVTAELERRSFK